MKRNLVGKTLGKIKIFVQDFVPIRTVLMVEFLLFTHVRTLFSVRQKELKLYFDLVRIKLTTLLAGVQVTY